jgi:outer membrane receptor protein involved in Fe transport
VRRKIFIVPTLFTLLSLFFAPVGEANEISGTVFIKGERKPLPGAVVFIESDDDISATTDEKGRFTLFVEGDGEYKISAFAMGYKKAAPVTASITGEKVSPEKITIYLLPEKHVLHEIVVRADRNPDRVSKTVITGKTLESIPGTGGDPLRAIQALPGVTSGSDVSGNPAIRGSSPWDNMYYVDFFPVGYLFHMGGIVSVFNADLVDDFNLFAAAHGPEFGDALGGILDVKLREPRKDRFGTKLQMSLYESDFIAEGPLNENQSFYVSARRSYFDLIIPASMFSNEDAEIITFPQYYDYQTKYVWKLDERNSLMFQANGAQDKMEVYIKPESEFAEQEPDIVGKFGLTNSWSGAGATLTTRLSANMTNIAGFHFQNDITDMELGQIANVDATFKRYLLKDNLKWSPSENHELLLGLEAWYSEFDMTIGAKFQPSNQFLTEQDFHTAEMKSYSDMVVLREYVFYMKERWKIADRLTVIPGLRVTDDSLPDETIAEPKLGIEYDLTDSTLITAGWGRYHQSPGGTDLIPEFGNPDLNFIKGEHVVTGIEKKFADVWSIKSEIYYKTYSDIIVPDTDTNPLTTKIFLNGGSGIATGIEMLLKKDGAENRNGWVSASWSESKRTNDLTGQEIDFGYDQPLILNLVYSYELKSGWIVGARWRFQSGQPYTPVVGSCTYAVEGLDCTTADDERVRPIYGEINSERLPDYHRLDIRFDRDKVYDRWKFGYFIEIVNVYARQNVNGYQYNEDYTEKEPVGQMPFLPGFGIKAEF